MVQAGRGTVHCTHFGLLICNPINQKRHNETKMDTKHMLCSHTMGSGVSAANTLIKAAKKGDVKRTKRVLTQAAKEDAKPWYGAPEDRPPPLVDSRDKVTPTPNTHTRCVTRMQPTLLLRFLFTNRAILLLYIMLPSTSMSRFSKSSCSRVRMCP